MRLRFIGSANSMGLRAGHEYEVALVADRKGRVYLTSPVSCPYASAAAFWRSWVRV